MEQQQITPDKWKKYRKTIDWLIRISALIIIIISLCGLFGILELRKTNGVMLLLLGLMNIVNGIMGTQKQPGIKPMYLAVGIFCLLVGILYVFFY